MARISYVKAWGLWSHFESVFEFSPGLTVITGPNGSGKSGFISIVRWVFLGEPSGEEFIFTLRDEKTQEIVKQAEEGRAEVGLDNGVVITKTRRKGKTTYTISTVAEPFEKAEVPQEVKDALGIGPTKFGDWETYLNFAFQLEAPFLISESPSVGAKVLGKLAGTEVVDLAIADIAKKTHKARDDKRIAEKEIERINGDLLDYQDLDDIKAQLDACEYLIGDLDKAASRKDALAAMKVTLENSQDTIDRLTGDLLTLANVETLGEVLQAIEKTQQRYEALLGLYDQLTALYGTVNELTEQLGHYEGVPAAAAMLVTVEANERQLTTLTGLDLHYRQYTANIADLEGGLALLTNLDVAAANLTVCEQQAAKVDKLKAFNVEHDAATQQLTQLNLSLTKLEGVEEAAKQLETLTTQSDRLADLQQLQREYNVKHVLAQQAAKDVTAADDEYKKADAELAAAWEASGGICPLCDQPVATHSHT